MIVVDAGLCALTLTSDTPEATVARVILTDDSHWIMPAHGPVETLRTIRRFEAAGYLSDEEAAAAVRELCRAEIATAQPEAWLLQEIWKLRHNVSPYDAAYVALARRFTCLLITFDKRLARAATDAGVDATVPHAA